MKIFDSVNCLDWLILVSVFLLSKIPGQSLATCMSDKGIFWKVHAGYIEIHEKCTYPVQVQHKVVHRVFAHHSVLDIAGFLNEEITVDILPPKIDDTMWNVCIDIQFN